MESVLKRYGTTLHSSDDSDGFEGGRKIVHSRPFTWESEELMVVKAELDDLESKNATPQSMAMRLKRGEVRHISNKKRPGLKNAEDAWLFADSDSS